MNSEKPSPFAELARLVHGEQWRDAATLVGDISRVRVRVNDDDPKKCQPIIWGMVQWLLDNGGMSEAAQILWSPGAFDPRPRCTREVWKLFEEAPFGLIMGAASLSKSYSLGVRLLLEWLRDPLWTTVKVVGPSEAHLQANLFSHLVALHNSSSIPLSGKVGDLFIGMDRRDQLSSITGVVIPAGMNKRAGRLQGGKRRPRPEPHPIFGKLSRLFIFIDEAENVPRGIWSDVDNVMANFTTEDQQGLRIFCAYNPGDQTAPTGIRAEPTKGWAAFDIDKDYRWTSARGWNVLRLDAEKSENVIAGKTIFPGLQTKEGLEQVCKSAGGPQSAGYYTMGRGAYPPMGIELTIIPAAVLGSMRGTVVWYEAPTPIASCDPALEGNANAVYTLGGWGLASAIVFPPSVRNPKGWTLTFRDKMGHSQPRYVAYAERQIKLPPGNTVTLAGSLVDLNRKSGVRGDAYSMDRTGNGAGVADLMRVEWSGAIHDVNFSQGATEQKIMAEDTKLPSEVFDRLHSELWFATRTWGEFGVLVLSLELDMTSLTGQMTQRRYRQAGGKVRVESKKDYVARGFSSPDEADSLNLFCHAARKFSGHSPSMRGGSADMSDADEDSWREAAEGAAPRVRLDPTNRTETLE